MMPEAHSSILVLEDEQNLGSTLVERLKDEGFLVHWARSSSEVLASPEHFDLALLDVGLPDGSGFDVAASLRRNHPATALIFLTACGNPEDRIRGLELGAEDYITKPFHLRELILRIRNGLKRTKFLAEQNSFSEPRVQLGRAMILLDRFEAVVEGETHRLTHKEAAVLKLLLEKRGKVVSRDEILDQAWSEDEFPTPRTVDNFILKLRKLVEYNAENPEVIRSVRGIGYQML